MLQLVADRCDEIHIRLLRIDLYPDRQEHLRSLADGVTGNTQLVRGRRDREDRASERLIALVKVLICHLEPFEFLTSLCSPYRWLLSFRRQLVGAPPSDP